VVNRGGCVLDEPVLRVFVDLLCAQPRCSNIAERFRKGFTWHSTFRIERRPDCAGAREGRQQVPNLQAPLLWRWQQLVVELA